MGKTYIDNNLTVKHWNKINVKYLVGQVVLQVSQISSY